MMSQPVVYELAAGFHHTSPALLIQFMRHCTQQGTTQSNSAMESASSTRDEVLSALGSKQSRAEKNRNTTFAMLAKNK